MAIDNNCIWEIRGATGSDTNGGGFVIGSGGTDYSQQDTPQLTVLDAVCSSTTSVTSVTGGFTAAMVGNVLYYAADGLYYEIVAVSSSNAITIDRNGPFTGGQTINIGGAMATLDVALSARGAQNQRIYIKQDSTYAITTTINPSSGSNEPNSSTDFNRIIGYKTVRGDGMTYGNQPILQLQGGATTGFNFTNAGAWLLQGLCIDCNNIGSSTGVIFATNGWGWQMQFCIVKNFTLRGVYWNSSSQLDSRMSYCEITGGAGTAAVETQQKVLLEYNNIHDNSCTGVIGAYYCAIHCNRIVNNTGGSSDGIVVTPFGITEIVGNLIYGSGRDGIRTPAFFDPPYRMKNNILASNGGYGINCTATAQPADFENDGNGFWNNTSGTRNNINSTTGIYADPAQYTITHDVVVTAGSPFVNEAGGDFRLNNTSLRGALLRAAGYPGTFFGASDTGYLDMGPLQHQDAGGSASMFRYPDMSGGMVG